MTMLISLISIFSYATDWHFTFQVNRDGTITSVNNSYHHAGITVTINSIVESENGYIGADITIDHNHGINNFDVYRLHANATTHRNEDETDPQWNIKLQPTINPLWCVWEETETAIHFVDVFPKSLILNENLHANSLNYEIVDHVNNHNYVIRINNVFNTNYVITGISDIHNDNQQTIYYDLQGHSSNHPFNGINIVKNNGKYEKRILKY